MCCTARTAFRIGCQSLLVCFAAVLILMSATETALAFLEDDATWTGNPADCPACHSEAFPYQTRSGPHGGYTTVSDKCPVCHTVHVAPAAGVTLLPKATLTANCMVCHDGTGGNGVYGAIESRGLVVGGGHSIDVTDVIPGGDDLTGGDRSVVFAGLDGNLSCSDCHSPHGSNVVDPFSGDRVRFHETDGQWLTEWSSSKLLRRDPVGSDTDVDTYGSDWCSGCHLGRMSGSVSVMNHSVDSSSTHASPFTYDNVAIVTTDTSFETTYGTLGRPGDLPDAIWTNRGYVMPTPRTVQQTGHAPICQQCHEDSRVIGEVGAVESAHIYRYGDGKTAGDTGTDNPLFQNFPHETENSYMLVENDDDLCLNCHTDLP